MQGHTRQPKFAHLFGLFMGIAACAFADTHYVAVSCPTPVAPYTHWTNAANVIQAAIDCAAPGDLVLVSNGTYSTGWRTVAVIPNRVVITNAVTVRSVNGPGDTSIVGQGPLGYGCVRCAFLGDGSVLSGFTLRNGATQSSGNNEDLCAGGVWSTAGAVVSNCVIVGNKASNQGGGAYGGTLISCILTNNTVTSSGGGAAQSMLSNCTLSGNSGGLYGGGAYGCTLSTCRLTGNSAWRGGGVNGCALTSCLLLGNTASYGGGAYSSTLSGCTITGNSAGTEGGGAEGGTLDNCILYANNCAYGANWYNGRSNPTTLRYCCTSPLPQGQGNIDADPAFTSAGDFHLLPTSPCINSGQNQSWMAGSVDIDGQTRIQGGIVDMGAFESDTSILTVLSSWGVPTPSVGDHRIHNGTTVTNAVSEIDVQDQTRYLCSGWSASGHDPAEGSTTNAILTVTNNITLTWNWQAQHWFSASADVGGSVDTSNGWINADSLVTATAIANEGYHFLRWTGDVTGETPVLQTLLDRPLSVVAVFVADFPATVDNRQGATNITSTSASLNGTVLSTGTAATTVSVRVYWGNSDGGTNEDAWGSVSDLGTLERGTLTANVSGLVSNSYYYYRVWSSNSAGVSWAPASSPFVTLCGPGPTTRYADITGTNPIVPYLTWATAATNIQDAVDVATEGDTVIVADGSYSVGGRAVLGYLPNRLAITKPITVRSVNGPDVTTIRGQGPSEPIMRGVWLAGGACLDGFTVAGGYAKTENYIFPADGWFWEDGCGGGVFGENASAIVTNCLITGNLATIQGGGVHGCTLVNCRLSGNSACVFGYTQTRGGGASVCDLLNCVLTDNFATGMSGCDTGGGACDSTLRNCFLSGNGAMFGGGGTDNCTVRNCVLVDNSAEQCGGGTYGGTLYNCTITGNSVWYGHDSAGIYGSTAYNCIVWSNTASIAWGGEPGNYADSVLFFSCTSPQPTGDGNIEADPVFEGGADFHLQYSSPCVDAGTNLEWMTESTDLDGLPRIMDGRVDMGAYESGFIPAPVPVPYWWMSRYPVLIGQAGGDYGAAALADTDGDGHAAWQEYAAGSIPTNSESVFRALIAVSDGVPQVTWTPDLGPARVYSVLGRTNLADAVWGPTNAATIFYRVRVDML